MTKADAHLYVPLLVKLDNDPTIRFFGFSILQKFIKNKWENIPPEEKEQTKTFVAKLILDVCWIVHIAD
jgi:hypothetical protein